MSAPVKGEKGGVGGSWQHFKDGGAVFGRQKGFGW